MVLRGPVREVNAGCGLDDTRGHPPRAVASAAADGRCSRRHLDPRTATTSEERPLGVTTVAFSHRVDLVEFESSLRRGRTVPVRRAGPVEHAEASQGDGG